MLGAVLLVTGAVAGGQLAVGAALAATPGSGPARTTLSPYRDGAFTVRAAAVDTRVDIASAEDGSYLLAHTPAGGDVVLDLGLLDGGTARPWWVEPSSGRTLQLADLAGEGVARFPVPDGGRTAWVLVVDDAGAGYGTPDVGAIVEAVTSLTGLTGSADPAGAARPGPADDRGGSASGRSGGAGPDPDRRADGSGGTAEGERGPDSGRQRDTGAGEWSGEDTGAGGETGADGDTGADGETGAGDETGDDTGAGGEARHRAGGGDRSGDTGGHDAEGGARADDGGGTGDRDRAGDGNATAGSGGTNDGTAGSGSAPERTGSDDAPERTGTAGDAPASGTAPEDREFPGRAAGAEPAEKDAPEAPAGPAETDAATKADTAPPADAPTGDTPGDAGQTAPRPAADAAWDRLAQCESSGDWAISTGNGYHGGLQFDEPTWREFGGDRYAPTADGASKDQQIEIATKVRDTRGGYGSWPACARELGLPR